MSYYYDGVGVRVRKVPPRACRGDDPDGTALYAGPVEKAIGADMPTDKQFTSQIRFGVGYVETLYYYDARAYDPVLGRFISPDTIVPGAGNGQAYNRYTYVSENPLGFVDPRGHMQRDDRDDGIKVTEEVMAGWFIQQIVRVGARK